METTDMHVYEKKLLRHITPKIEEKIEERLRYKIVQSIIDALEEQFYPPEEMIREEFIRGVEEAEEDIKKGKRLSFKNVDELRAFLDRLKEE